MAGSRARTLAIAPTKTEFLAGVAVLTVLASVIIVRGGRPNASFAEGVEATSSKSAIVPARHDRLTPIDELRFTLTPVTKDGEPANAESAAAPIDLDAER